MRESRAVRESRTERESRAESVLSNKSKIDNKFSKRVCKVVVPSGYRTDIRQT